eukprot:CAMPEP_0203829064 /NCGR_PEP_ID=MMETSP0115-20131106/62654_1 /ASSEMBLY_ACC=CAM_ASM_000227 /TAXON_ID=33651 /ORGANISM="Bicosoecid sp, Strain ms1" /LENGTH=40 /DNA_ID= /DNA_START= /DNA_END= /DNA_ORIENTATION=
MDSISFSGFSSSSKRKPTLCGPGSDLMTRFFVCADSDATP